MFIMMIEIISIISLLIAIIIYVIAKIIDIRDGDEIYRENMVLQKYSNIFCTIILVFAAICFCYKLDKIPQGLHVDETGAFYDAICISKYGVDRYLYKLPVYLINFGGGQSALYAYLAAVMIKIFGASVIAFRLPSVCLSLIAMVTLYNLVKDNSGKREAVFSVLIFAICPWNIMKTRWGLDCNLMSSMMIISTYVFSLAINKEKNSLFIFSGILFGITLYTYVISYMVLPVVLGIFVIYLLLIKRINIKQILFFGIPLAILAFPLILMIAYNSGWVENVKIPIFSIPKLWFFRGEEISLKNILENLKNIVDILFIKDFLNYNAIPQFGTLYMLSIPLAIFGLIECIIGAIKDIKHKEFSLDFLMILMFVIVFFVGLCIIEPNVNKINAIYIPIIYFIARVCVYISQKVRFADILIIGLYILNLVFFLNYYFTDFAKVDLMYFENDIIEASQKAEELKKQEIYVENSLNQTYIYTLIATPISPYEFNENLQVENGIVNQYGKYKFWIPQEINKNSIYIIKNDQEKIQQLKQNGFQSQQHGQFTLLWN